jgi:16S rRNA processing protein RimM
MAPAQTPAGPWIELGRVLGPFGVRGWVRIESFTEPRAGILAYRTWHLRRLGERRMVRVQEARPHGRQFAVRIEGCADRDGAARLAGDAIEVPRSALPPLGAREYYRADLVGMTVRQMGGEILGTVAYFVDTPAHAVMVVQGERERWVPASARHLRRVDLAERTVWVDWQEPEG